MTPVNTCPRCGKPFHCGAHDAAPCACTGLRVSPHTLARLRTEHVGCLCLACLREEAERDAGTPPASEPVSDSPANRRRGSEAADSAALLRGGTAPPAQPGIQSLA